MNENIKILDGLKDEDRRKTIVRKLIEENIRKRYNRKDFVFPFTRRKIEEGTGWNYDDLADLINSLIDELVNVVSNP
jgi:anaerobic ribonucleoside-triphosphate reductase